MPFDPSPSRREPEPEGARCPSCGKPLRRVIIPTAAVTSRGECEVLVLLEHTDLTKCLRRMRIVVTHRNGSPPGA